MLEPVRFGEHTLRPLGVGTNSWNEASLDGAREALLAALDAGITLFDTAEVYSWGESERAIGRILRETGRSAVIATKFAPLPQRLDPRALSRALDASLGRLGLARVDLYQIHWPYSLVKPERWAARLADEVEAGRIGGVGVSNYSADQMHRVHAVLARRGIPLLSNQVNYSLLQRAPESNGVLDACRELGATLIAYTPLASGALTGKYRPDGPLPTGYRRYMAAFRKLGEVVPVLETLEKIGRTHQRSPAQVALNWLARQQSVLPIPGAKDARQATDNAAAIDFAISDAEAAELEEVSRRWRA